MVRADKRAKPFRPRPPKPALLTVIGDTEVLVPREPISGEYRTAVPEVADVLRRASEAERSEFYSRLEWVDGQIKARQLREYEEYADSVLAARRRGPVKSNPKKKRNYATRNKLALARFEELTGCKGRAADRTLTAPAYKTLAQELNVGVERVRQIIIEAQHERETTSEGHITLV